MEKRKMEIKKKMEKRKMDSRTRSKEKNTRKNIANILEGLGFKDTPQSRKLDPWMTRVLAGAEQQQQLKDQQDNSANRQKRSSNDLDSNAAEPEENKKCAFVKKKKKQRTNNTKKTLSVKKKQRNDNIQSLSGLFKETPTLAVELRNKIIGEMGGSDLVFVTEKVLTATDVSGQQSRFSIPRGKVANEFLRQDEKSLLKMGISVKLMVFNHDYQHEIKVNDINLTRWKMTNSYVYVLNETWNSLVQEYKLKKHLLVQLWAFRVQSLLYFALVKLQDQLPLPLPLPA